MRFAVVICLCAFALAGCAGAAGDGSKEEATPDDSTPKPERPHETARISCERDGTRVLTPEVRAQRDGVHFEIENRLGKNIGFAISTPESGMGDNAPKGTSHHVKDFPPGELRIGCHPARDAATDYAKMKVLAGSSDYKSVELECPGGMSVSSGGGLYTPGTKGKKEDPVELVRSGFSKELAKGDVVETAGYPASEGVKTVRATRDGKVMAVFEYRLAKGGWIENGYSACAEF